MLITSVFFGRFNRTQFNWLPKIKINHPKFLKHTWICLAMLAQLCDLLMDPWTDVQWICLNFKIFILFKINDLHGSQKKNPQESQYRDTELALSSQNLQSGGQSSVVEQGVSAIGVLALLYLWIKRFNAKFTGCFESCCSST